VKRWLARHKRFILHFTPTSCSWINLVERLFAEITRQRIRRGIFHDVAELKAAINEWIEHRNQDPKPFTWTATAKTILVKHRRAKKVLAKAGRIRHGQTLVPFGNTEPDRRMMDRSPIPHLARVALCRSRASHSLRAE
jgi:hypothetical protein